MDILRWLIDIFNSHIEFGNGQMLLVREVIGNAFGLASALGGMYRKVWAWPVGIAGNALLLTVFLGSLVDPSTEFPTLLGQAGRQVMFIAVSIYGWVRWRQSTLVGNVAVTPAWTGAWTRIGLVVFMVGGTAVLTPIFHALGSYAPYWSDAWTFVGSLLATYGMAKGWTEFWLVWVAVDLVGVPLLFSAGYYASAFMYVFYGAFTLIGFFVWWRARRRESDEQPRPRTATERLLDIALLCGVVALAGFYIGHLLPVTQPVTWFGVLPVGAFGFVAFIALALIRQLALPVADGRNADSDDRNPAASAGRAD